MKSLYRCFGVDMSRPWVTFILASSFISGFLRPHIASNSFVNRQMLVLPVAKPAMLNPRSFLNLIAQCVFLLSAWSTAFAAPFTNPTSHRVYAGCLVSM